MTREYNGFAIFSLLLTVSVYFSFSLKPVGYSIRILYGCLQKNRQFVSVYLTTVCVFVYICEYLHIYCWSHDGNFQLADDVCKESFPRESYQTSVFVYVKIARF